MDIHIKVGGEAGFGIMASGLILVRTFARGGLHAITINDYPSLIRGGHNVILVRVADHEIFATDDCADILIALNKETVELHKGELRDPGAIIYDPESFSLSPDEVPPTARLIAVPLMHIAKNAGADVLMRNTVALGATLALIDYPFEILQKVISDQFKHKGPDVINKNVALAQAGYDHVKKEYPQPFVKHISPQSSAADQVVLTGNEAVGIGAIMAGMKFFAAYPMTPINGLLYYLASTAVKHGFVYKQPEDEISGINMAIGASFAGVRSMVATSGGGFSLMVEGTSFAGMIEQPVVIVYGQRPGPATGLPTWTTQGDLHFILNAGQGEFPRLVLAPGDIEEAYYLTTVAFNLAEKYQTPTFVVVDKYLCETYFTSLSSVFTQQKITIDRGKLLSADEQNREPEAKRYLLTDDGISPRPIPGRKGGVFRANSDEHNELGYSIEDSATTKKMIEKRMRKLEMAQAEVPPPQVYGNPDATTTLIGWGSTKGPVLEVIRRLSKQGKADAVNYIHLSWLNPFPADALKKLLQKAKKVIDIEGNHNSQLVDLIHIKTGIAISEKITKYDGRPFYPNEIIEELQKRGVSV